MLLLTVTLTGCKKANIDLEITKETIETCGVSCLFDEQTLEQHSNISDAIVSSSFVFQEPDGYNFELFMQDGLFHERTDLNIGNSARGIYFEDILVVYSEYWGGINDYSMILNSCEDQTTCSPFSSERIDALSYGFDDVSGYITYNTINDDDEITGFFNFSYALKNNQLEYVYQKNTDSVKAYAEFIDGVYKRYTNITESNDFRFWYFDTNTFEQIIQRCDDDKMYFYYYDSKNNFGYVSNESGQETYMFLRKDNTDILKFEFSDDTYTIELNFLNMGGWTKIKDYLQPEVYNSDDLSWSQVELYNGLERVYNGYEIHMIPAGKYYNAPYGVIEVTEDEIGSYSLPDEYTIDINLKEFRNEFINFINSDDRTSFLPYTQEELHEILESF